ncbi:hypothetical protein FOL47_004092 [Perkinsus chesapeaki]|uniref:Uncharacterized protein n=1 Tax=Perkinsus chesapeaki TaxID=330153 RepID=A0A7J6M4J6_PERCH|nr:hypothetical protein FOL47_004092 [Perkinsus chesapeaki]
MLPRYRSIDKFECFKSRVRIPSQGDWEDHVAASLKMKLHLKRPPSPLRLYARCVSFTIVDGVALLASSSQFGCGYARTPFRYFVFKAEHESSPAPARYIPEGGLTRLIRAIRYGFSVLEPILMARLRPSTAPTISGTVRRPKTERRHLLATNRPATSKPPSTMPVTGVSSPCRTARVAAEVGHKEHALRRANEMIEEQRTYMALFVNQYISIRINGKVEYLKNIISQKQRMDKIARSRARRQERIDDAYKRGEYYPVKARTAEDEQAHLSELIEAMRDDVIARDNRFRDEMESLTIHGGEVGNKMNGTTVLQAPKLAATTWGKRASDCCVEVLTVNSYGGLLGKVPREYLLKGLCADELIAAVNNVGPVSDNDEEQSSDIINDFDRMHGSSSSRRSHDRSPIGHG